jgi:hypothetical protein
MRNQTQLKFCLHVAPSTSYFGYILFSVRLLSYISLYAAAGKHFLRLGILELRKLLVDHGCKKMTLTAAKKPEVFFSDSRKAKKVENYHSGKELTQYLR